MCRCVVSLFSHLFGVPISIWRLPPRKRDHGWWRGSGGYFSKKSNYSPSNNSWTEREDMESNYDEDLNENLFFQQLQRDYSSIFEKSIREGWILCVPRAASFSRVSLAEEDFLGQILVPSDELPASHFRTLTGNDVRLCNKVLTVDYDIAKPCTTHILFEETFYTPDLFKYRIWCVERLLDGGSSAAPDSAKALTNLTECTDFLWTEILNKNALDEVNNAIKQFQQNHKRLEDEALRTQRDLVATLYARSLGLVLKDSRLREKTASNRHLLQSVKTAVETYVLHGLRNLLPRAVAACTALDDASLNKTIKNLHELQLRDLGVRADLYSGAVRGKLELARIDGFATVLGKIGCLRRAVRFASQGETSVSSDDLLPVLIFLVIRAGLPNWIAQLVFMKQFRFSSSSEYETDEAGFLITSLEAAVEHVRSGVLIGSVHPEADNVDEDGGKSLGENAGNKEEEISVRRFFEQVKNGDRTGVLKILSEKASEAKKPDVELCHPLCACDNCEKSLAKDVRLSPPTVHSRDDRGLTALHIAALYGQANMVDLLIEHGSNVDEVDADGTTPLHCSAARGHQNTLLLLLHANADPTITDAQGNTVLHLAADNGHEACVKALVYFSEHTRWPVDPNLTNCHGDTPLHYSSKWGYTGIVEILLEHGAQPKAVNRRGQTPLALAHSTKISRLLETAAQRHLFPIPRLIALQHPLALMQPLESEKRFEPVHPTERIRKVERLLSAIFEGDLRLACYYLGLEGPEKTVELVHSLCHPLCTCERCSSIEEIPEEQQGKPALGINSCDSDGQTALHVASAAGRSEFVQTLLDAGAKLSLTNKSKGQTPLHLACLNDQLLVTKILLNSGDCDVDVKDNSGDTPLHLACRTRDAKLVELLVRHGASSNIRNLKGVTAAEEAEDKVMLGIGRILIGRGSISH